MSDQIETEVRRAVGGLIGIGAENVTLDEALVGPAARLKSRDLIMLVLDIEEFLLREYNAEFNWFDGGDAATVQSRLRTVGSLVDFVRQRAATGNVVPSPG
ncbi:MAG: hypothetical protein SFW09_21425 [Hyphomicrobiaceae bacterium]|nr:hypothetical protein [Hyphomicrobiaceae bacterium]